MATLTVRLPAAAAQRTVRVAAWSRRSGGLPRPMALPQRATEVIGERYALQPPTGASTIELAPLALEPLAALEPPAAATAGAGWFESTWELQQGLDLAEGLPVDMPLEAWLEVYLAG